MNELNIKQFLKENYIDCYEIKGNQIRCARHLIDKIAKYLDENNYIYTILYKFGSWSELEIRGYKVFTPVTIID